MRLQISLEVILSIAVSLLVVTTFLWSITTATHKASVAENAVNSACAAAKTYVADISRLYQGCIIEDN